jgi:multidrug efflux pump subunit AcrA (membrane-fusion protein)
VYRRSDTLIVERSARAERVSHTDLVNMKRLLRTRRFLIAALVVLIGAPAAWLLARDTKSADEVLIAKVKKGEFKVTVTSSGELKAPKFVQIGLPANAQQAESYQLKIQTLVAEGTQVKEGDIVAEIDRSTVAQKLADYQLAQTKADAVYEQAALDSLLNLSKAREDIHTGELELEGKKLAKEQSKYEAPSVQRQADIDYEKADRALAQSKMDYNTKTEQAKAKMREVGSDLDRQKNKVKVIQDIMSGFTIKAPSPGMVIYLKDWNGKKRAQGSTISPWDPGVATLPDLTQMESSTYVNEIDVRKLSVGQPVAVTLDADASKRLVGIVTAVANVGEQRPNADAKVFEVKVTIQHPDTTLRPGMTTANAIETYKIKDALYVPLEAVTSENSIPYVFKKTTTGTVKQEVELGALNDNEVVVQRGLDINDRVLLSPPADKDKLKLEKLAGSRNVPGAKPGDDAQPAPQPVPVKPAPPATKTTAPAVKKG